MTSISSLELQARGPIARQRARAAAFDRHRVAVVQAEARRLARILRPFGVLPRRELKRRAHSECWHEGSFDAALHAAVGAGEIEPLPLGFYRNAQPASDQHS